MELLRAGLAAFVEREAEAMRKTGRPRISLRQERLGQRPQRVPSSILTAAQSTFA